ncbi:MAG: hypothetical protein Q8N17_03995 [Burkholderiaceae bacterium]|nr:hypothetical protein [Burkholderiaceae bacterium]
MEVLLAKRRLSIDKSTLEDLQRSLLNINRLNQHWLTQRRWKALHSEDNNFVDDDAVNLVEYCRALKLSELFAAETRAVFSSTRVVDARVFPCSTAGLSQALYGLPYPLNLTHEDAGWIADAAVGINLIFGLEKPMQFLILRDGGGVVTIAGPKSFVAHMTRKNPFLWKPGLPP